MLLGALSFPVLAGFLAIHYLKPAPRAASTLPLYGQVPAFTLVDHHGRPFTQDALKGRVWIADFIFTRCAGQCPMMTARVAELARRLPPQSGVALVSFTVDPGWDTPQVLAAYAARLEPSPMRWHFVTGDEAALHRLCRDGFHLAVADGQGTAEEPITHSVRLALVDRGLAVRGYYDATDEDAMRRLRRDLDRLLNQ